MDSLPTSIELSNEFHALLVRLGKEGCRGTKTTRPTQKGHEAQESLRTEKTR